MSHAAPANIVANKLDELRASGALSQQEIYEVLRDLTSNGDTHWDKAAQKIVLLAPEQVEKWSSRDLSSALMNN